jgi:hypothetical protein
MADKKKNQYDEWIRQVVQDKIRTTKQLFIWVKLTRPTGEMYIFDFVLDWWGQLGTYRARLIECDSAKGTYVLAENVTLPESSIDGVKKYLHELYGIEHVHMRGEPGSEERMARLLGSPTVIRGDRPQ